MAPDFEIFQKLEIMRMISFFLPNLRLGAVGTPELWLMRPRMWFRHTEVGQVPIVAENLAWQRDRR